eukprot:SAG25_NODE_745_length_5594_cov_2.305187_1_plen_190_part_00
MPWPQSALSHPVGLLQVDPLQPLVQLQVCVPPSGTQLPLPQSGLLSHPVGEPQVSPLQPMSQLHLWLAPFTGAQVPWPQSGSLSHPVAWLQVSPDQPLLQVQLQGLWSEDRSPWFPQSRVQGAGGDGGPCPPIAPARPTSSATNAAASRIAGRLHRCPAITTRGLARRRRPCPVHSASANDTSWLLLCD